MNETEQLISKTSDLLRDLDVPEFRLDVSCIHNLKWLTRNLRVRNVLHPNYDEVMIYIRTLIHMLGDGNAERL